MKVDFNFLKHWDVWCWALCVSCYTTGGIYYWSQKYLTSTKYRRVITHSCNYRAFRALTDQTFNVCVCVLNLNCSFIMKLEGCIVVFFFSFFHSWTQKLKDVLLVVSDTEEIFRHSVWTSQSTEISFRAQTFSQLQNSHSSLTYTHTRGVGWG